MPLGRWASRPLTHDLSHMRQLVLLEVQERRHNPKELCYILSRGAIDKTEHQQVSGSINAYHNLDARPIPRRTRTGLAFLLQTLGYGLSHVLYISIVETGNGYPRVVCHIDVIMLCGPQSVSIRASAISGGRTNRAVAGRHWGTVPGIQTSRIGELDAPRTPVRLAMLV
jgi:hypothetical protein